MKTLAGISLNAQGYFCRDGRPFFPVGVNYWPSSCGVEMWQEWPEAEILRDLDVVQSLGMNCVRFFLRWPDFEPEAGQYDQVMFDRLRRFLQACAARNLLAHPALVIGFMSGGHFWPKDRGPGNLYSDPVLVARCAAYCKRAAAVMAPFHETLLAVDLGNELGCIPDSWSAPPASVLSWCGTMSAAIREAYPRALVVSGLDSGPVFHDNGWRLGELPGVDFYTVHTYPVPNWNVVPFDGMTDPYCQAILPFCTLVARSFAPVMVQEFSSILTCGAAECSSYLRAVLAACRDHGANGFLWWCLKDIDTRRHPYAKHAFEGRLGLVDDSGRVKPELVEVIEFYRAMRDTPPPPPHERTVALYWPQEYYRRDNPRNPGNDPTALFRRLLTAYYLLSRAGHSVGIARGGKPFDPGLKVLVITGAALTQPEADHIESWVKQGGRIIWSGPSWPQWAHTYDRLIGAQPVDICPPCSARIRCFGSEWTLDHFPSDGRVNIRITTARILAASEQGEAVILANELGKGRVITVLPVVEDTIVSVAAKRAARDRWSQWYAGIMNALD